MSNKSNLPAALIVGFSQDGEKLCSAGGRISTQPGDALEILEKSNDPAKNSSLIEKVTKSGHNSTVEHAYFNIAFNNVSIMTEQFLIEYRLASFTVKSRRYVDFGTTGYVTPDFQSEDIRRRYESHIEYLLKTYRELTEAGIPKEDARFVLPYCVHSNFYCSMNARELLHVLRGMLYGRGSAFEELYRLGTQLLKQAKTLAPGIFGSFEERKPKKPDQIDLSQWEDAACGDACNAPLVELLHVPEHAEALLAKTALIWGTQLPTEKVEELVKDPNTRNKVIEAVMASSRPRPLESLNYTFRLNRVSLAEVTHIARHRMQNVSFLPLTRVCRETHVLPPSIQANTDCLIPFNEAFQQNARMYHDLQAQGIPEEQLAYLVLSGNTMDVVTTINARELLLFFKLRTCRRAQWEIQKHAGAMLKLLRERSPDLFRSFGPSCYVEGSCPEGRFTCGHYAEVQREYTSD